jgi:hypothetical protein
MVHAKEVINSGKESQDLLFFTRNALILFSFGRTFLGASIQKSFSFASFCEMSLRTSLSITRAGDKNGPIG